MIDTYTQKLKAINDRVDGLLLDNAILKENYHSVVKELCRVLKELNELKYDRIIKKLEHYVETH